MPRTEQTLSPLQQVIQAMEPKTQQALADALGIKSPSISDWKRIPEDRCARIEELTGIRCEVQRPDLMWLRGADGKVTHCMKALAA